MKQPGKRQELWLKIFWANCGVTVLDLIILGMSESKYRTYCRNHYLPITLELKSASGLNWVTNMKNMGYKVTFSLKSLRKVSHSWGVLESNHKYAKGMTQGFLAWLRGFHWVLKSQPLSVPILQMECPLSTRQTLLKSSTRIQRKLQKDQI